MSLHYTFPRHEVMKPRSPKLSREGHINKNLDFQNTHDVPVGQISSVPYVKSFSCSNPNTPESLIISSIDDPIDDIFQESHRQISQYKMELPGGSNDTTQNTRRGSLLQKIEGNDSLIQKIEGNNSLIQKIEGNDSSKKEHSVQSTPVRNNSAKPKTPVNKEISRKLSFSEDSSLDPLACHADNIMRMAMDSTLAHSFSSNFSNLVDDTHLERSRRFPGFNERPIVEISAADLENAVNDPFRL